MAVQCTKFHKYLLFWYYFIMDNWCDIKIRKYPNTRSTRSLHYVTILYMTHILWKLLGPWLNLATWWLGRCLSHWSVHHSVVTEVLNDIDNKLIIYTKKISDCVTSTEVLSILFTSVSQHVWYKEGKSNKLWKKPYEKLNMLTFNKNK